MTLLRFVAAALAAVALLCLARVGPGWLCAGLSIGLAVLAVKINGRTLTRIDTFVQSWLAAHRSRGRQVDANAVFSYLGQPIHFAVVVVFCGTLLALQARSAVRGALVVAVVGTGVVVEQALKAAISRTAEPLAQFSHGFPSGHVTVWAAFLGMVAVCLGAGRSTATRAALAISVLTGVVVVGFLALYSGAHIVTDILGGVILGGVLVALGAAILRASPPRVRLARAADMAAAVSAHTTPMRTEDILYGRGY